MKRPIERAARHTVVASIATALLLGFAGAGLSQILVKGPQQNGGSSLSTGTSTTGNGQGNGGKVQICHMTGSKKKPGHTLWVAPTGAQAHLKHHKRDHAGPCTQAELHPTQATASSNPKQKHAQPANHGGKKK